MEATPALVDPVLAILALVVPVPVVPDTHSSTPVKPTPKPTTETVDSVVPPLEPSVLERPVLGHQSTNTTVCV